MIHLYFSFYIFVLTFVKIFSETFFSYASFCFYFHFYLISYKCKMEMSILCDPTTIWISWGIHTVADKANSLFILCTCMVKWIENTNDKVKSSLCNFEQNPENTEFFSENKALIYHFQIWGKHTIPWARYSTELFA